jgi:peptidoglycan pentaglycine glycine transferase (the first glycine)
VTTESAGWRPEAWDGYVRSHPRATYLQTTAWARVKRSTGWAATNVGRDGGPGERFGALLLTRPIPLLPWRFAYAPRGPLADEWNETTHRAWSDALRTAAARAGPLARTAIVRMEPESEEGDAIR